MKKQLKVAGQKGDDKKSGNLCYSRPEKESLLFFSLLDYKNTYYTSKDFPKIKEFYNSFKTDVELFEWMNARPKGNFQIVEVEGDKDVIIVIPTTDYDGEYARTCREVIFFGFHILFIVSGKDNFYFNYSHNCNAGIRKALEYSPTWIVLSNDDMVAIDMPTTLKEELNNIDPKKNTIAFCKNRLDVNNIVKFGTSTLLRNVVFYLLSDYTRTLLKLERKFGIKLLVELNHFPERYFTHYKYSFRSISDFAVFSADIFRKSKEFYDETFVVGAEDLLASLEIYANNIDYKTINYSIGSIGGATVGSNGRMLKDIMNMAYLNYKMKSILGNFKEHKCDKNL